MPTKVYTLTSNTSGFDQVVSGQQLILNGHSQFHADGSPKLVPTGHHKQIIFNASAPNSFGTGDDLQITNLVTNNTINAQEFGTDLVATVLGVQDINVKLLSTDPDGDGSVTLEGGFVTNHAGQVVANYSGLTNVVLTGSAGASGLSVGSFSNPLETLLTNIGAQASTGRGEFIQVTLDSAIMTSPVTVNVALNTVGAGVGSHTNDSDDYIHGAREAFAVGYGSSDGTVTAATWNLTVTGKNFVELFTHGATNTTTVNMSGAGSLTLFGVEDEFRNVTTINDTATGAQIITGALQQDGSSKSYTGFLAENSALTSLNVTSTNAGNFVDLSNFDSLSAFTTLHIGGGTVVLDDDVLLNLSSALPSGGITGGVTNIGWGGDDGTGPGGTGTINWALLPSSANTLTFYHGVVFGSSGLTINGAPNAFTVKLQDEGFHSNTFAINVANAVQATNVLNLDLGSAQTGGVPTGINGEWTTNGYDTINISLAGAGPVLDLATNGGFIANPSASGGITINVGGNLGGVDIFFLGNVSSVSLNDYQDTGSIVSSAAKGLTIFGGLINDTSHATLDIGPTDAETINAATGNGLFTSSPDTDISGLFTVVGSVSSRNFLQGSLGLLSTATANFNGAFFATGGSSNITGGADGNLIYDTAGNEMIHLLPLNTGTDSIFFSHFSLSGTEYNLAITDDAGNFSPALGLTTVTGFDPALSTINFASDSWGVSVTYRLAEGDLNFVSPASHAANVFVDASGGTLQPDSDMIALDPSGTFTTTSAAAALEGSFAVAFPSPHVVPPGFTIGMLVAFNVAGGVEIADAQMHNPSGSGVSSTGGLDITVTGLVHLVGVTLSQIDGLAAGGYDVVHWNST